MKKIRNEEGITLVALIVTIVILVILAAVTIRAVFENNFLIMTTKGVEDYARKQIEEEGMIDGTSGFLEEALRKITSGGRHHLAEKITFTKEDFIIEPGESQKLEVEISPQNTTNTKLDWRSSDETVVTVKDGTATAIKEGAATITAKTTDGSNLEATCTITVKKLLFSEKVGYVSDGLILHYDGIQNTREGHKNDVRVWEDLSGNGKDSTLNGGTWNDDSIILDGTDDGVYVGDNLYYLFKSDNTIEIRVLFDESGRDVIIGNYYASQNINYEKYNGNQFRTYFNDGVPDKHSASNTLKNGDFQTLTCVMNKTAGKIEIYNDTNKIDSATVVSSYITNYNSNWTSVWIGRDARTGETCLKGKIQSVRVYNRILSSEEIMKNNQIDKERFETNLTVELAKQKINASNFKEYIGEKVEYKPEKGGIWRIFYFDTEGLFGPKNSIIIKMDDSKIGGVRPSDHFDYEPDTNIIERMKKADPAWARSSYSDSVNSNAERFLGYCCDPTNWTEYYDSNNSEFISCIPSLYLYIKSLSIIKNDVKEVKWTSDTVCTYGGSGYNVLQGQIPTSNNGVYEAKSRYYIFCSPAGYRTDYFWGCDFVAPDRGEMSGLYAGAGTYYSSICPIVYLK